jgi:hypothetical protein
MSLLGLYIKIDNESWLKTKVFKRDVLKLRSNTFLIWNDITELLELLLYRVNAIEEATYPMVPCGYDEVKISVINSRNIYL